MSRRASPALLSMVVPCFDEEAVISEMHRRLVASLEGVPDLDFEIVYVDDGSRDATLDHLRGLQEADPGVRVLSLPRNFGHQIVLTAGLAEASAGGGDAIVTIDADLQDPPGESPRTAIRRGAPAPARAPVPLHAPCAWSMSRGRSALARTAARPRIDLDKRR